MATTPSADSSAKPREHAPENVPDSQRAGPDGQDEPDSEAAGSGSRSIAPEGGEAASAGEQRGLATEETAPAGEQRGPDGGEAAPASEGRGPERGEAAPAGEERGPESGEAAPAGETAADSGVPRSRRGPLAGLLTVLAVIFGAFAVVAAVNASQLQSAADANIALTDHAATQAVTRDIARTVTSIFSYNYADTARTRAVAQKLLTGQAIRQYDQLFALVEQQAPRQKLVVTTTVTNIGVELMTADRARLLVFVSQQDTRSGTQQSSYAGAMFAVNAVRDGGTWKIANIDTFTGG